MQDSRYGIRTLVANPGSTATAIICLALGIGLNGAIFSVVDGVLLQPLPYPDADRIVVVNSTNQGGRVTRGGLSWLDLRDLRDESRTIASIAGFTTRTLTISDGRRSPSETTARSCRGRCSACSARLPLSAAAFGPMTTALAPSVS